MRWALVLAAATLAAGCTSPFGGEESDPWGSRPAVDSGTQWMLARWEQPGLYARMPEPGSHGEMRVNAIQALPGIPMANETLPERFARLVLTGVSWSGAPALDEGSGRERLSLDGTGTVRALLDGGRDNATVASLFTSFVTNLTTADEAQLANWTETLLASRVSAGSVPGRGTSAPGTNTTTLEIYTVAIAGNVSLTTVLPTVLEAPDHNETGGLTAIHVEGAGWQLTFAVRHWTATGQLDGELVQLTVNARDETALLVAAQRATTDDEVAARAVRVFEMLGIGAPETEGWTIEGVGRGARGP